MDKTLKRLVAMADKASSNTRWGYYPMAPSVGLSEKEIRRHQKAVEAHALAFKALKEAGFENEAEHHRKAMDRHSWVTERVGNF